MNPGRGGIFFKLRVFAAELEPESEGGDTDFFVFRIT